MSHPLPEGIVLPKIQNEDQPALPDDLSRAGIAQLLEWREALIRIRAAVQAQLGSARSQYRQAGGHLPRLEYRRLCSWQRQAKEALCHVSAAASRVRQEITRRNVELANSAARRRAAGGGGGNRWRDLFYNVLSALAGDPAVSAATRDAVAEMLDFIDREEESKGAEAARRDRIQSGGGDL